METVYIVDIMRDVVTATQTEMSKKTAIKLHYEYGPLSEIVDKRVQMTKRPSTDTPKYPLIALLTDIKQT